MRPFKQAFELLCSTKLRKSCQILDGRGYKLEDTKINNSSKIEHLITIF